MVVLFFKAPIDPTSSTLFLEITVRLWGMYCKCLSKTTTKYHDLNSELIFFHFHFLFPEEKKCFHNINCVSFVHLEPHVEVRKRKYWNCCKFSPVFTRHHFENFKWNYMIQISSNAFSVNWSECNIILWLNTVKRTEINENRCSYETIEIAWKKYHPKCGNTINCYTLQDFIMHKTMECDGAAVWEQTSILFRVSRS